MTRVEKKINLENQVKELVAQVQKIEEPEKRTVPKNHHGKIFGGGLVLALFLVLGFWVTWILAAAGLVTVPVISSLAYKIPTPIHQAASGVLLEAYVSEFFNTLITERLQTGDGELIDREVSLVLSETTLTASLRDFLAAGNLSFFETNQAQVAIEKENGVEIFIPLANSDNKNALRVLLKPTVENDRLSLGYLKISLGNFTAPGWFSDLVLRPLLNRGLELGKQKLASYSTIDDIKIGERELEIRGTITVEIKVLK